MTHPLSMPRNTSALVTGAARGLGAEIAVELARQGFEIGLVDLDAVSLADTDRAVKAVGRRTAILAGDVADSGFCTRAVETCASQLGSISVLVNNAGITRDAQLAKMTEAQWAEVLKVNLTGVFLMGQAAARHMADQKRGRIINISSVARRGNFGQTNYAASKAGVDAMAKTWAVELARFGITANCVAPGFIATAMTDKVPAEVRDKIVARIPMKRMGSPADIAHAVAFLASDAAGYITGQCITVDGGLTSGLGL